MIEILSKENLEKYEEQLVQIDNSIVDKMKESYSTERWDSRNFRYDRPGKWKYSLIDVKNGLISGCVIITEYKAGFLHINRFFVNPQSQRNGTGKQLTAFLRKYLLTDDISQIDLFVSAKNTSAIQFYEKNGFRRMKNEKLKELMEEFGRKQYGKEYFEDEFGYQYYAYTLEV